MSEIKNNWTIIKVEGADKRLYNLIGPLVMNPEVLAANENYPFRNTDQHIWYIALRGKNHVSGFLSIAGYTISNDYVNNNSELLEALLERVIADQPQGAVLRFIAHINELPLMEKMGFVVTKPGIKYFRVLKEVV
ncbi:MAG: GNAT family N-acetyltransferase [Dysgonamonadaceae bacterium]|jgi:hypothetical protein|nr:GNAT family N-acetyltransferase [Dysgonamonadaceae bacterium]